MKKIILSMSFFIAIIFAFQSNILAKEPTPVIDSQEVDKAAIDTDKEVVELPEIIEDPEQKVMMMTTTTSGGQPYQSTEKFQVEPSTGTASINIPIEVPAGRRGIQPNPSLMYNSSSPNGILGVGWNLELGSIQRSTKRGVPTYNDSQDTFVLTQAGSSQELVPIGGNQYRAKIEGAFMKFEYQGPVYGWLVTDKKGIKYYFGSSSNSQQYDPAKDGHIFKWCLDRVEDLNGNYMKIFYHQDLNQRYPDYIRYTYHNSDPSAYFAQIDFGYMPRTDTTISYRTGFAVTTAILLNQISIKVDGQPQRSYKLNYEYSPSSKRSILTSITQYGADDSSHLPATTFSYQAISNNWNQVSGWNIPIQLAFLDGRNVDMGVRLIDVNGDGFADIVRNYRYQNPGGDQRYTYINDKTGGWYLDSSWEMPEPTQFIVDYGDWCDPLAVSLADVNGDGLVDILKAKNGTKLCYLNNNPGWIADSRWLPPIDDNTSQNTTYVDVNGDGLSDALKADGNIFIAWINNGSGWEENGNWAPPSGVDFGNGSWTLADVNGDGLPDIIKARDGNYKTYLNNGAGWTDSPAWYMPEGDFERSKTQLVDINSDGLPDILIANDSTCRVLLNNGNGWSYDAAWSNSLSDNAIELTDGRTRFLDADGDGLIDLMRHYNNEGGKLYLNGTVSNNNFTDLLSSSDNGIGATTEINYTPSTQYDNTGGDGISDLSFPIQTVSSVTATDQVTGQSYTTNYEYKNGLFDFVDREFRGFGEVKVIDPNGNYTETFFEQNDNYKKGRILKQETFGIVSGQPCLYAKTENTWVVTPDLGGDSKFVYLSRVNNYLYDGDTSYKQTATEYQYDNYGNVAKVSELGDVSQSGDERYSYTEYTYNTADWLLSLPKTSYIKDASDSAKIKQAWYYYDGNSSSDDAPTHGLLTKQEDWLNGGTNPTATFIYDGYGNLLTTTDALGRSSSVTYDSNYHIFALTATNALGHQVENKYYGVEGEPLDDGTYRGLWGQLKSTTDPNNKIGFSIYDTFGRIEKQISPEDSVAYPTSSVEYDLDSLPIKIVSHQREVSGQDGTLDSVSFYDGLGRLIQTKTESEDLNKFVVSGQSEFNSRGLPYKKYLPKFSYDPIDSIEAINPQDPHATVTYDAMGRVIQSTNPDGTYSTIIYDDWETAAIDENGHKQKSYFDAYGRLIKKEEYTGTNPNFILYASTQYFYDTVGNLIQTKDAHNNITTISYDTLGRKMSMDDPDMGVWSYAYDKLGNLISQTDAKGKATNFAYDNLNRLLQKSFSDGSTSVNYAYDDAAVPNSKGRLTKANYQVSANTKFEYDDLGREIKSTKKIESTDYQVQRSYDSAGRLISVEYPDQDKVYYSYNNAGQIESVASSPIATDYQTKLLLHADGTDGSTVFSDNSNFAHSITANGNAQLDTVQYKFGGASAIFDGDGDYLSIPDSNDWNFGSGDFTIDFWVNLHDVTNINAFCSQVVDGNYNMTFYRHSVAGGKGRIYFSAMNIDDMPGDSVYFWTPTWSPDVDTWHHIALVRNGAAAYIFIDGISQSITYYHGDHTFGTHDLGDINADFNIGYNSDGPNYLNGWIDEFRFSRGIARWTSNFDPPIKPHTIESGVGEYYVENVDYNASGQITKIKYGNGNETDYTYDPNTLRLTRILTRAAVSASPRRTIIQDLSYQYDSVGNITSITDNVNTASQTFQYDELNRLVVATGAYGTKYYDYDEIGNMTLKDGVMYSYGNGSAGPHALTSGSDGSVFTYDANGNMASMTDSQLRTFKYEYDSENRLKKVIKSNQALASFAYDGDGGRTKKTLYKYSGGGGGCFLAGTPILMSDGSTKPIEKVKVGDEVISFDEEKNLLVKDTVKQTFIHKTGEYFILNGELQVTGEHPFYSQGEWRKVSELKIGDSLKDSEGNLTKITNIQKVRKDVLVYNLEVNPYHTYFANGYLVHNKSDVPVIDTGVGFEGYSSLFLDKKAGTLRYVFEFLTSFLEPQVAEAATVTEISTIFVGSLYELTSGSPTKHIFLGSQRIASITNGQINYYHTDHLGSTNVITNDAGTQIALYEYKPYGEFSKKEEASADPTEYFFTGKKLDDETGLYYYGARYYNPAIGRFITPDPTIQHPDDPQDLNRYSYCRNNPLNLVDPSGLGWWKSIKKFFSQWGGLFGMAGGLINGIINNDWRLLQAQTTSLITGFILSGGNPYAAMAAMMATSFLDTPPGQQFTGFLSNEVFDDAFGMSPRTAYMVGNMVATAIVASAIYITITPASYTGPDYTKAENQKGEISKYGIEDGDAQPGGSTANFIAKEIKDGTDMAGKTQWYQQGRVASDIAWKGTPGVDKVFGVLNVRHAAATVNVSGKLVDSAKNVSLKNLLKGRVYASPWTATSHQALFGTLVQSGMSGTQALGAATSQAGWSFYLTSSIYGVEGHSGAVGLINAEVNRR